MKEFISSLNKNIFSQTARSIYWVFSGNTVTIVVTFFTTLFIASFLSVSENGIFLALFSFANLLSDFGEFGIGSSLSHYLPRYLSESKKEEAHSFFATAFFTQIIVAVIITLIPIILAPIFSRYFFENTPIINIIWTAGITFTLILFAFSAFALSAYQRFTHVSILNSSYSVIRLGLLLLASIFLKLSLSWVLIIYFASSFIVWLVSYGFFGPHKIQVRFDHQQFKKLISFSSILAIQKLLVSISSRLDLLMMVPLAGSVAAGIYGIASRFGLVYPLLISSLSQVIAPNFAKQQDNTQVKKFLYKVLFFCSLLVISEIPFYFATKFFIGIFLPKYISSVPILGYLLIAMSGFILATPFTSYIVYFLKKPHLTTAGSFVQLLTIFIANVLFIPQYKELAPVIGIGLGNIAILIISAASTWYYLSAYENRH